MGTTTGIRSDHVFSAKRLQQKREQVRLLLDDLADRLAGAVPGLGLDAEEDGVVAGLGGLEGGGELLGVRGDDAVVGVGGGDQGRWVGGPGPDVVEWRVLNKEGELGG